MSYAHGAKALKITLMLLSLAWEIVALWEEENARNEEDMVDVDAKKPVVEPKRFVEKVVEKIVEELQAQERQDAKRDNEVMFHQHYLFQLWDKNEAQP